MATVMPKYDQGPSEVLDYPFDLYDALAAGEQITSATFTAAGLTIVGQNSTTTNATVWLSGGAIGTTYTVTCVMVTNQGRTYDRSCLVLIVQR